MTSKTGKVLNPFKHARLRPDTYIGSAKTIKLKTWIFNDTDSEEANGRDENEGSEASDVETRKVASLSKIIYKKIKYNPGMTSIFIEIMSNAIDNLWRSQAHGIPMRRIDFQADNDPDSETYGWITIKNDGYCIPIEKTEYEFDDYRRNKTRKETLYPAEVFFGEMLAGTNFEDDEKRKTSGRNGMGGKAMVIFSSDATIEHTDPERHKKLVITFSEHGTQRTKPVVTSYRAKTGYTQVSFRPDYEYFGYEGMDGDFFSLIKKYVHECAMITGLNVTLNGEKIIMKNLEKYVRLYYPDNKENALIHLKAPNGDECVLIERGLPDLDAREDVPQVSWINGINTRDGGIHVKAWVDAIFPLLVKTFNARKTKKGEQSLKTTAKELYPYFTIFVRAEVFGAEFSTQTKERLTGPKIVLAKNAKQSTELTASLTTGIKKMMKWNFITLLEEKLLLKAEKKQTRKEGSGGRKVAASKKYSPANFAGGKQSKKCTLIISEGLSAKTFADRLFKRDYYGSYAIRGKFINVQNATMKEISENAESQQLKKILGLVTGVDYTDENNRKLLKYGKVLIITDQDDDGFHIRGLLLNFFHHLWPGLFDIKCEDGSPFVESLTTAVAMVRRGKEIKMFFSNPEFQEWMKNEDPKELRKLINSGSIKYFKGLGTHEATDAKLYSEDQKRIFYVLDGEEADYMDLGFNKHQSNWRKEWITRDMPKPGDNHEGDADSCAGTSTSEITVSGDVSLSTFVDTQLIIYHIMALRRALPNMFDGFKESQRKAFYGIMMDKDARKRPINLENLAGSVKKITGYHHGGTSLQDTIIKMAQGFVGSNNIPLLKNAGEFGTRVYGGDDAAAARYITTNLEDISWAIFPSLDDPILTHAMEDGENVEYKQFMPIIPMILINGANGIASGYSTNIPCYNPEDIVKWIELWLGSGGGAPEAPARLKPWYRGYIGEIELLIHEGTGKSRKTRVFDPDSDGDTKPTAWRSKGILEKGKKGWWNIKELPVCMWTSSMTEHLEYLMSGTPPEGSKKKKGEKCLKDIRWKGTTNTINWEILPNKEFVPDIEAAGNFKNLQSTSPLTNMHVLDSNGYPRNYSSPEDLLQDFCSERLRYYGLRKDYWLKKYKKDLQKESDRYKYVKAVIDKKLNMYQTDEKLEADMKKLGLRKVAGENDKDLSYDYLLSMQMRSMTVRRLAEIEKEILRLKKLVADLQGKEPSDLWLEDLATFKVAYAKFQKTRKEE